MVFTTSTPKVRKSWCGSTIASTTTTTGGTLASSSLIGRTSRRAIAPTSAMPAKDKTIGVRTGGGHEQLQRERR
jgi:hypothetical protein